MTAAHAAAYTASDEIIRTLADNGADLRIKNNAGLTTWDVAVLGQTANGGAGNIHPGLRWNSTVALLRQLGAAPAVIELPDGPGNQPFERVCSSCHVLDKVTTLRLSGTDWKDKVDSMVRRGAMLTPQELNTVVDYLGKNFGPASNPASK